MAKGIAKTKGIVVTHKCYRKGDNPFDYKEVINYGSTAQS